MSIFLLHLFLTGGRNGTRESSGENMVHFSNNFFSSSCFLVFKWSPWRSKKIPSADIKAPPSCLSSTTSSGAPPSQPPPPPPPPPRASERKNFGAFLDGEEEGGRASRNSSVYAGEWGKGKERRMGDLLRVSSCGLNGRLRLFFGLFLYGPGAYFFATYFFYSVAFFCCCLTMA